MDDDELAVEHNPIGQAVAQRSDGLGECVGQIVTTASLDAHALTRAEDKGAESIPFGFEGQMGVLRHFAR